MFVVDVARKLVCPAITARRITINAQGGESRAQCIVENKLADERFTDVEENLDCFDGLERTDHAGQDAEDARFGTRRRQFGRWRFGKETPVTRTRRILASGPEYRHLALESEDAAVHVGQPQFHAGVVDEIARWEIVTAVNNEIVSDEDLIDPSCRRANGGRANGFRTGTNGSMD